MNSRAVTNTGLRAWRKTCRAGVPTPADATARSERGWEMDARARRTLTWQVFAVLMAGALVGLVAILPYVFTLLDRLPAGIADGLPSRWVLVPAQLMQSLVLIGL